MLCWQPLLLCRKTWQRYFTHTGRTADHLPSYKHQSWGERSGSASWWSEVTDIRDSWIEVKQQLLQGSNAQFYCSRLCLYENPWETHRKQNCPVKSRSLVVPHCKWELRQSGGKGGNRAGDRQPPEQQSWLPRCPAAALSTCYFTYCMWFNFFSYLFWSCVCVGWCSFPFSHLSSDSCSALAKLSSQRSLASFSQLWSRLVQELAHCHCLCVNEFFLFLFPPPCFIIIPLPKAGFSGWSSILFISAISASGQRCFFSIYMANTWCTPLPCMWLGKTNHGVGKDESLQGQLLQNLSPVRHSL